MGSRSSVRLSFSIVSPLKIFLSLDPVMLMSHWRIIVLNTGRVIPHSGVNILRVIVLSHMKIIQKKKLMFGDLMMPAPQNWGADWDKLVINTRPVVFSEQP